MTGREIDALIAEKVMGCTRHIGDLPFYGTTLKEWWEEKDQIGGEFLVYPTPKPYSQMIEYAFEVVKKIGDYFSISTDRLGNWTAGFGSGTFEKCCAEAKSAPLAICLAALKAKGIEVPT